jgi:hypothetical protein
MPSDTKIEVIKAPIPRITMRESESASYANRVIYYIKLSNGLVITKPEDFPENTEKKKEKSLR